MPQPRSVLSSAKLIAFCTLGSRITGLLRDMLLAQTFGLTWVQDAFSYAFQVPNLFRRLFGEGAMSPVFVPVFTQALEHDGRPAAWRLLGRTLTLLTLVLGSLTVAVEMLLLAIWLFAPGQTPEVQAARGLVLGLTGLMLPFALSICVLALLSSVLNCLGSFVPAALAPVILNLAMIAGIVWLGPLLNRTDADTQIYGVALSVLLAGLLQIAFLWPALRRHGVRVAWEWPRGDPRVVRMLALLGPVAAAQGTLLLGVWLDSQICLLLTHVAGTPPTFSLFGWHVAFPLQEGALSAVTMAQRLYQFPLGVLVISIATAALPAFSLRVARQEWPAWTSEVRSLLRLAVFEGLLAGAMMVALAEPIVRLLFQYGEFDAAKTTRTAHVLAWYGVGVWAFCAQQIVSRGFFSFGEVRTPLWISCVLLPLNMILTLLGVWLEPLREAAFAVSASITSSLGVVVGLVLLQRRAGQRLVDGALLLGVLRMLVAAGLVGAAVWLLQPRVLAWLSTMIRDPIALRLTETLGWLAVGSAAYIGVSWLLGLPEARELQAGLWRRILRRRAAAQTSAPIE